MGGEEVSSMPTAVLGYEPERIRALIVLARAVVEHLASAPPDDPLATDAITTAAAVRAHIVERWLPALAAVEASRALLDPIGMTNAEVLAAAQAAAASAEPGVFVGTTKTYEVLETPPTTTIPTAGHDPDGGSGHYDLVVTEHWYREYNLGQRPAVFAATPGGWVPSIVARILGHDDVPEDVMDRGQALEAEVREARETAGGSIRPQRNVAVGRLTKSDDEVVSYRTVSGEAPRPGFDDPPEGELFPVDRNWRFHSEIKILESAGREIGPEEEAVLEIFSERPPCSSCNGVIERFHDLYPNVQLRIYYRIDMATG
jgi:hypothetical protein